MKFKVPSRGQNAATFLLFFINCTRTALRIAEFGCFASIPLKTNTQQPSNKHDKEFTTLEKAYSFSRTIPLA
jgi:hypothetical protein